KGPLPDRITVDLLRQIDRGTVRVEDRDRQHLIDAYDAEIRSMDRAFGVFVSFLKEKGLYDPALIVVTSDHGEEFGEHGRLGWHSHSLFDELLRVPLLVKLPASRLAGTSVADQVRGIDVAPTVLSALGLGLPSAFEGHSALDEGARRGDANEVWSSRDVTTPHSVVSLRTPEWKLFDGRLYSLADDPGEQHDVAKAHEDVARRLGARRKALATERPRPAPRSAAPDDALRERLRSLGYVE
ncbi:MAG TPA: sulfatase-like hydrolase/transferase, partial [Vicinamibacteria bacterium]|nr:sulfatase-like hydrolase/transferase [Vicinamibacteria bacterium]